MPRCSSIDVDQRADTYARSVVEQAVQQLDAVAEIGPQKRCERAAVPSGVRGAEARIAMFADAVGQDAYSVVVVVEIVGFGQFGEEPSSPVREGDGTEEAVDGRTEKRRRVLGQSRENGLAVVAEVGAEECQELDDDLVLDLPRDVPWPSRTLAACREQPKQASTRLKPCRELAICRALSNRVSDLSPFLLVICRELAIGSCTPFDQSLAEQDAEAMSWAGVRYRKCVQPAAEKVRNVFAGPPRGRSFEQLSRLQNSDRLGAAQDRLI